MLYKNLKKGETLKVLVNGAAVSEITITACTARVKLESPESGVQYRTQTWESQVSGGDCE